MSIILKPFTISALRLKAYAALFPCALFCLAPDTVFAQSPPVVWSRQISGPYVYEDYSPGIALDRQDNFYYAGSFSAATFPVGNVTLTNRTEYPGSFLQNGFLAKFSPTGNFLWVQQIGGEYSDEANACVTDAGGNIFVTGIIGSTNIVLDGVSLSNAVGSFCYLAKFDPNGNLLWARQSSNGQGRAAGTSLATDTNGNVWVAGYFDSSNVTFGANTLSNASAASAIYQDFLVKYDVSGNEIWAGLININSGAYSTPQVGVDSYGNTFFSDQFLGNAQAGSIPVAGVSNQFALLLAKFDSTGNALWAKEAAYQTNGGSIVSTAIAVDSHGNCRLAGNYYFCSAIFASTTLPAPVPASTPSAFVANFDGSGDFLWTDAIPTEHDGNASLDAVGNLYAAGSGVISKFGTDGTLLWQTNSLGMGDFVLGAVDPAGSLYVAGGAAGGIALAQLRGPTLNIQPAAGQVVISWLTNEAGLGLQSANNLSGPWSFMTNPAPPILGNQFVVTNGVSAASQFYRLAIP